MIDTNFQNKRIIFFSAHPDDEIAGAGGLLIKARNQGATIRLVLVIDPKEARIDTNEDIERQTRIDEYQKVAELFGASMGYIGLPKYPTLSHETIDPMIKELREFKPDIAIMLSKDERHTEHRSVYEIVMQAIWHAGRPAFPKLGSPHQTVTVIEAEADNPMREPNFLLDISDVIEEKQQIFSKYDSQLKRKDLITAISGLNTHRGLMYRKGTYAEAFKISEFYYG